MITPIEIRQQTFNREFRGYDRVEVDAFLNEVSKVLEKQLEINRALKEELEKTQASYNTLKEVENMLHKTLIQAEQSSKTTVENARQKAELKIREAEARSREIMQEGVESRNRAEKEIGELENRRDEILMQMQVFLQTQLDRLSTLSYRELPSQRKNGEEPKLLSDSLFGAKENGQYTNGHASKSLIEDIADEL